MYRKEFKKAINELDFTWAHAHSKKRDIAQKDMYAADQRKEELYLMYSKIKKISVEKAKDLLDSLCNSCLGTGEGLQENTLCNNCNATGTKYE